MIERKKLFKEKLMKQGNKNNGVFVHHENAKTIIKTIYVLNFSGKSPHQNQNFDK